MLADHVATFTRGHLSSYDHGYDWPYIRFGCWLLYLFGEEDFVDVLEDQHAHDGIAYYVEKATGLGIRIPSEYYFHYAEALEDSVVWADGQKGKRKEYERFVRIWDENQALPESAIAPLDPDVSTIDPWNRFTFDFTDLLE